MLKHTCVHCGCVLGDDEAFAFEAEIYCEECLD